MAGTLGAFSEARVGFLSLKDAPFAGVVDAVIRGAHPNGRRPPGPVDDRGDDAQGALLAPIPWGF